MTSVIRIVSYGIGHNDEPRAHRPVVVDTTELRNPPDDPAVRARLTQLTGLDPEVHQYVMTTPGARQLVDRHVREIDARAEAGQTRLDVLVHCYGGRHRSVAIAQQLAAELGKLDHHVQLHHRHINHPLLPSRRH
ncbi:hypothetical protein SLA_3788 [Streptomyces laurentii]|uniref:RapZ C-terminal domain-containing protein n=1 Tax=Streptomyces laurentii TaxID=39478 RepID=A0A169NN81_STRLU|nr:hypothetical protein SLA_3788 [Streptomyces laurentii]